MHTIIEHKWAILLTCEVLAWVFLFFMLIFRYWLKNKPLFWISTVLSAFFGYVPHVSIPILIAIREKSVMALVENKGDFYYTLFIIVLLIFGFTIGKKYLAKFDRWMFEIAKKQRFHVTKEKP